MRLLHEYIARLLFTFGLVTLGLFSGIVGAQSFSDGYVFHAAFPENDFTNVITHMPNGFYWLGNSSGIYRFDGHSWKHFVIVDTEASYEHNQFVSSSMFEDPSGQYWFTTFRALHAFDPLSEKFRTFRIRRDGIEEDNNYRLFYDDSMTGELLLMAGSSVYSFNKTSGTYRLLLDSLRSNSIHHIEEDGLHKFYGAPWWNAMGFEYFEYNTGGVVNYMQIDLPVMIKAIAPYNRDSIFLSTPEGLQLLLHPLKPNIRKMEVVLSGESRNVAISQDRQTVYTSMDGKGIFAYQSVSNELVGHWEAKDGLRGNDARSLTADGQGNLFVSHLVGGIDIIATNTEELSFISSPTVTAISDLAITAAGDLVCVNEAGELYRYDPSGDWLSTKYSAVTYPAPKKARIGSAPNGEINVHGHEWLVQLDSLGRPQSQHKLDFCLYRGVISFADGERILVGRNGLLSVRSDAIPKPIPGIGIDEQHYFSNLVKIDNNRFLACYDEVAMWDIVRQSEGWKVQAQYPLPGEMQTALALQDQLFIGTSAGLQVLRGGKLSPAFNPLATNGNLWVNALYSDAAGRLWLGTEQGLFCYFPTTGEYLYFSKADGLKDDWFIRANVVPQEGNFIMATKTGLVVIDPHLADTLRSDNDIFLSDVWVNGIRQRNHSLYQPKSLVLDFQHNSVSFLAGMVELSSSPLTGFRYRLQGLEDNWTYQKIGEVIRYPSLPPGNFTFLIVGIDKNGRSTSTLTLAISIAPPFYQAWWFWLICATFLGLTFYYFHSRAVQKETVRQQRIQKEEARKAAEILARHQAVVHEQRRIMMELHDDLGGTLGSLFYTLDGYLMDQENGVPVTPDYELLKETSGSAMKKLREVMSNNNSREMSLASFVRSLADQARRLASETHLQWELELDPGFPNLQISSHLVHNVQLIVKEALSNIRKHSQANSFTLSIHLIYAPEPTLEIKLCDNGIGFGAATLEAPRKDGTGNGLLNIRKRAGDIGGVLLFSTPSAGGTIMTLRFSISK